MRKLLLASAAMLGATSGIVSAQTPSMPFQPSQGMMVGPSAANATANTSNNANGQPTTFGGYTNTFFGAIPAPQPGTVVIRLNGKVEADVIAQWSTNNQVAGVGKTNPVNVNSYMRLYPAVDGMATNGLRYGAAIELRENFPGSTAQATPALVPAPSGSTYSSGETVFVRRAFVYMAADNVGTVRIGQGDGVIGLFDPCIFSAGCWDAGVGNFNGGELQATGVTGANAIPFVWLAQAGAEYGNSKIVYLSPQFFGVDFGLQYASSMGNGNSACTTAGAAVCNSETSGTDATRWFNQVAVGARWQGTFGPVQAGLMAVYETAGKETFYGAPVGFGRGLSGNKFDNLSFVEAAGYATLDTGIGKITASVDYNGGAINGQLAMRPTGGVTQNAIVTGLLYKNGPLTLGTELGIVESQGSNSLVGVSQRHEWEVAFGGNYNLAPGLYLVGEYMYTSRHQGGFDFVSGANGAGSSGIPGTASWKAGTTRDAHGQGILFSTVVNW
jgi:hypothetical protein